MQNCVIIITNQTVFRVGKLRFLDGAVGMADFLNFDIRNQANRIQYRFNFGGAPWSTLAKDILRINALSPSTHIRIRPTVIYTLDNFAMVYGLMLWRRFGGLHSTVAYGICRERSSERFAWRAMNVIS